MSLFSLLGTQIIMNESQNRRLATLKSLIDYVERKAFRRSQLSKNHNCLSVSLININLWLIYGNLRLKRKQCFCA